MMTNEQKDRVKASCVEANKTLNALGELAKSDGFRWFMGQVCRMRDKLADEILHMDMGHAEREELRQRFLQLEDVLQLPAAEERSANSVLESVKATRNDLDF